MSRRTILGIVAEYDPFHNGHLLHLTESIRRVRPDSTYIALSPCFKQRGDLSVLSPLDRAACAVKCGADAVFALPVLWTVRDAEHYALGAVAMLSGLGITHLAFGAETADLPALNSAAALLEDPPETFQERLREALSSGSGYPAALCAAASSVSAESGAILSSPNNILAVCYLRAIRKLEAEITPVPVQRSGAYHDPAVQPDSPSASAIRGALYRGAYAHVSGAVPACTAEILSKRFLDSCVPDPAVADTLLLSTLRDPSMAFDRLPDISEGLDTALKAASVSASGRSDLIRILSGKRYPAARISRLSAMALLRVDREKVDSLPLPSVTMLLAMRKNPEMTSGWKDLPVRICASFPEWRNLADPEDLAAWRIWALAAGAPDTLPFTEKILSV
ncbi:MAG: nucleotidyltransferase family protein [Clostridiales bacterium]|nr:nucleotidyltransferase family protein [Clostridiales bacterium]